MKIEVHLHTILQQQTSGGAIDKILVNLPTGSTVSDLLSNLNIKLSPKSLLLAVNGRVADEDQVLVNKDIVHLMPAISGG